MKIFITITVMFILGSAVFAQSEDKPVRGVFASICNDVVARRETDKNGKFGERVFYRYEQIIWESAGADPDKDTDEQVKIKIQKWWEIYKRETCNSDSLFKFAIAQNNTAAIYNLLEKFELDVNSTNKGENKTLLDNVDWYIVRLTRGGSKDHPSAKEYIELRNYLLEHGAKSVLEINKRSDWTSDLFVYSGEVLFFTVRYNKVNDDFEKKYPTILAEFDKAIEKDPENIRAYYARTELNTFGNDNISRLNSALADLNTIIRITTVSKFYELLYIDRAIVNCRLGNKTAAKADEARVVEISGGKTKYGEKGMSGGWGNDPVLKRCQ